MYKRQDVDCVVHHAAAAAGFAGMLANVTANGWERIILTDQAHSIIILACTHQRDIARDIHPVSYTHLDVYKRQAY